MDRLEVPEPPAGPRVEREEAVAEEIRALAIAAEHVVRRRAEREVGDAPFLVDRDLAPRIDAAGPLPGAFRPRVVSVLARVRNRVERPHQLARDDVEGGEIAGGRAVDFAGDRHDDEPILAP